MFRLILVAEALQTGHRAEQTLQMEDPELVTNFVGKYDTDCWYSNCQLTVRQCAEIDPTCRDHFFCPYKPEECFQGVKWSELSQNEIQVFACAKQHGCAPKGVGPDMGEASSFLEAEDSDREADFEGVLGQELASHKDGAMAILMKAALPGAPTPVLDKVLEKASPVLNRQLGEMKRNALLAFQTKGAILGITHRLKQLAAIKDPTPANALQLQAVQASLAGVQHKMKETLAAMGKHKAPPSALVQVMQTMAKYNAPAQAVEHLLASFLGFDRLVPIHNATDPNAEKDSTDSEAKDGGAGKDAAKDDKASKDGAEKAKDEPKEEEHYMTEDEIVAKARADVEAEVGRDEEEFVGSPDDLPNLADTRRDPDLEGIAKEEAALDAEHTTLSKPIDGTNYSGNAWDHLVEYSKAYAPDKPGGPDMLGGLYETPWVKETEAKIRAGPGRAGSLAELGSEAHVQSMDELKKDFEAAFQEGLAHGLWWGPSDEEAEAQVSSFLAKHEAARVAAGPKPAAVAVSADGNLRTA